MSINYYYRRLISMIKELREQSGMTKKQFADYFEIPLKTIQNWESETGEKRGCAKYLYNLMVYKLKNENLINNDFPEKTQ